MDSKKIIESLVKIARNQQKIIHKLAQAQEVSTFTPGTPAAPASNPLTGTKPGSVAHKDPQSAIVDALGAFYTKNLSDLRIQGSTVTISFLPGKATQPNYDYVLKTVQNLQNSNVLMGGPYSVKVSA